MTYIEILEQRKVDPKKLLHDHVNNLESLIRVCDGRKMDERLAREFAVMIEEIHYVVSKIK